MNNNKTSFKDHNDEFQVRLAALLVYKKVHADLLVLLKYAPNIKLGAWVKHQKNQYKLYKEGNTPSSQLTSHWTQSLPCFTLAAIALNIIMSGRMISSKEALKEKLIGAIVPTIYSYISITGTGSYLMGKMGVFSWIKHPLEY